MKYVYLTWCNDMLLGVFEGNDAGGERAVARIQRYMTENPKGLGQFTAGDAWKRIRGSEDDKFVQRWSGGAVARLSVEREVVY